MVGSVLIGVSISIGLVISLLTNPVLIFSIPKEYLSKKSILDKEVQKVVYLKIYGGMTFKEIGCILGKSEVWARVNFYRAKQKMREENKSGK